MEASAAAAAAAAKKAKAPINLKVSKPTTLVLTETKPFVLSEEQINVLTEKENDLAMQDRHEAEKSNAKNALEEYMYMIRDKVITEEYLPFIAPDVLTKFQADITELDEWLCDVDDVEKSVYLEKFEALKAVGDLVILLHDFKLLLESCTSLAAACVEGAPFFNRISAAAADKVLFG